MEHTDIAPLAKRLAEENNVEWRRLRGSGERGRVVERDVLEYLARVMAGDEDVNPTPEPVPEGMQSWPDEDVRAFEHERRSEVPPPTNGLSTVDDEIFLLDGDDDLDDLDAEDDVVLAHDPYGGGRTDGAHGAHERPDGDTFDDGAFDDDAFDDDDLLVAGNEDEKPAAAPARPDFSAIPDVSMYGNVDDDDPDDVFSIVDDDVVVAGGSSAQSRDLPDLFDDRSSERELEVGPVFEETVLGSGAASLPGGPSLEGEDDEYTEVDGGASLDDAQDDDAYDDDSHDGAADDEDVYGDLDLDAPDDHEAPDHEAPAITATRATNLPLMRHGAVWRRQVDLTSLVAAQADVAHDIGRGDPVPALAFLARAAAKAMPTGSLIAIAILDGDGVRTYAIDAAAGSFTDVVGAIEAAHDDADDGAEGYDLVVADLADLEIDEAVLHLGVPVLSMGRVLIDSSTGGRRATLALSGDTSARDAGRLVARTADLLESPVRIVL